MPSLREEELHDVVRRGLGQGLACEGDISCKVYMQCDDGIGGGSGGRCFNGKLLRTCGGADAWERGVVG